MRKNPMPQRQPPSILGNQQTSRLRLMTGADLPAAVGLSQQARWNQTPEDWHRFLALAPSSCFVAEVQGQVAGSALAFTFDTVGWLAMVLVDPAFRGRGIGTELVRKALSQMDAMGIATQRLDATHLGQPIYEKLGFRGEYPLARFAGVPRLGAAEDQTPVRPADVANLEELVELDYRWSGTNRRALMAIMLNEAPVAGFRAGAGARTLGYALLRPGREAWQAGPIVADDAAAGVALLHACLRRVASQGGHVMVDVPLDNRHAVEAVVRAGLVEQRRFLRMSRGRGVKDDPGGLWASSGPEKG